MIDDIEGIVTGAALTCSIKYVPSFKILSKSYCLHIPVTPQDVTFSSADEHETSSGGADGLPPAHIKLSVGGNVNAI